MFSHLSHQCDICFQPSSPFSIMRILPVTPIIALSGTATPTHVRTPGATISVCRHCLQAYSNLEPCTDPASSPALPDASASLETPNLSNSQELPASSASLQTSNALEIPDSPASLDTPDAPSQPISESGTHLAVSEPLSPNFLSLHDTVIKHRIPVSFASFVRMISFSISHEIRIRSPPLIIQHYPLLQKHLLPV